jgi:hypothetical protein
MSARLAAVCALLIAIGCSSTRDVPVGAHRPAARAPSDAMPEPDAGASNADDVTSVDAGDDASAADASDDEADESEEEEPWEDPPEP